MPKLSDWKPTDKIRVLVFGKFKTGKSWGAFTFPRCVVLDYDKGIATARNPEFVKKYGVRDIFYEQFEEGEKFRGVPKEHRAFDQSCMFFDEWMKARGNWKGQPTGRDMFDTWVIDSGTTLSEFAQYKAVFVMGKMELSKSHELAMKHGLLVPKIQDFGSERSLVEQFVDMVLSTDKNVVLVCHEKELMVTPGKGQDPITVGIVPLFTGKSTETIPLKFDEVYRLELKPVGMKDVRVLRTVPYSVVRCGSRYGLPDESPWNYETIKEHLDKIHAEQVKQMVVP